MDGDPWPSEACLKCKKHFSLNRGRGGVPMNLAGAFFSPPSVSSAKLARGRRWFFVDPGRVDQVWKNHLTNFLNLFFTVTAAVVFVELVHASPAPASDCITVITDNLLPCLDYVRPGNNSAVPPKNCCDGLATVVKTNAHCLCLLLRDTSGYGFQINTTKALGLPMACNVSTPPLSTCRTSSAPVPAPAMAHGPLPHGSTSPPPGTVGASPPQTGGNSGIKFSVRISLAGLAFAFAATL